ncbi:PREDICTED: serine/threonine/tyrosine-interacting-like protein 1 [Hipposideros armiger]|uniref:Serine/threonine/tyrosine-interacting-like protein 1 n=1 Tax=Hipposideros armiger TaxID=186990 RepID=A0A8B7RTD3_HIPAR|nr:PREDICTED: serine/threonine/tyrosine-interacting-like protein 1 [Hipposideros armiger]
MAGAGGARTGKPRSGRQTSDSNDLHTRSHFPDVRSKQEYDESHVITALRVKKRADTYLIPESVDLECVKHCVVYDNNTSDLEIILKDDDSSDNSGEGFPNGTGKISFGCSQLSILGEVILSSGNALGHICKERVRLQELDEFQPYPVEIVPGKIYLGNFRQACDPKIQKDLKIKAHVNVSMETGPFFLGDADKLLHIQIEDSLEAKISPFLRHICHFIEIHLQLGSVILVFSTLGISRSCAAILAYLMHQNEQSLKRSWAYVKKCKNNMHPNRGLVIQLLAWEKIVLGDFITDISDPLY